MTSGEVLTTLPTLAPGDRLQPQFVVAHNGSLHSDNRIHDDEVARKYGFAGGLVPGVTVFAYMAGPLAAAYGARWLSHGGATVSLVHPLYEGERATSNAVVIEPDGSPHPGAVCFDLWTENPAGQRCATGTAWIAAGREAPGLTLPDFVQTDPGPAPLERPELTLASAPIGQVLARLVQATTPEAARDYADAVFDSNSLFREGSPWGPPLMHPGWLLSECNRIFTKSFRFGPWIHTRSEIRYLGPALAGRTLTFHGRLAAAYEKRQHHYAALDIFCLDDAGQAVMHVRHTAIFKVHPKE